MMLSFSSYANVTFDSIELDDGFASRFTLKNSKNVNTAKLDCQSFFHKFDIFDENNMISESYITINECSLLYKKVMTCLEVQKFVCFKESDLYEANCRCD